MTPHGIEHRHAARHVCWRVQVFLGAMAKLCCVSTHPYSSQPSKSQRNYHQAAQRDLAEQEHADTDSAAAGTTASSASNNNSSLEKTLTGISYLCRVTDSDWNSVSWRVCTTAQQSVIDACTIMLIWSVLDRQARVARQGPLTNKNEEFDERRGPFVFFVTMLVLFRFLWLMTVYKGPTSRG